MMRLLTLTAAYFVTGWLGLQIPYIGSHITLVWLPTGIAVAALFRWGLVVWPGVYLGAFLVNLFVDSSWPLAAGIAVGNTIAPLLAVAWLRQVNFHPAFNRQQDITSFIVAASMGMLASASVGCFNLYWAGFISLQALGSAWASWWMGDTVGVLLAAPLLLNFNRKEFEQLSRTRREVLLWILVAGIMAWFAFIYNYEQFGRSLPLAFLTLPLIVWAALRFGNIGASLSGLGFSLIAAWSTSTGHGLFFQSDTHMSQFLLWSYMATTVLMGLLITALQAERRQVESALRESELQLRTIIDSEPECVKMHAADGSLLQINRSGLAMMEADSADQVVGTVISKLIGESYRKDFSALTKRVFEGQSGRLEFEIRGLKGSTRWLDSHTVPLRNGQGNIVAALSVTHDITRRKRSEVELLRMNRTLSLIRKCNQILVYAKNEGALLEGICHRIGDNKDYLTVWAGFAEDDADQRVRPVAWAGIKDQEMLAAINGISWGDSTNGRGPTGTALRTGKTVVTNDLNDPRNQPWRAIAERLGIASAISLPLKAGGKVLGVISIYARQADAFEDKEVELLSELADDLAYGLVALREAAERLRVEKELLLRQQAVDSSGNGIMIATVSEPDISLIYVNPAFERITGYSGQDVIGRNPGFLAGDDKDQIGLLEIRAGLRQRRAALAVLRNYRKDGSLFWNELSLAPVCNACGEVTHFVGIINDITERVSYETQLERHAHYDELTGLANRNLLTDRMEQAITYAHRTSRLAAVMMIDLDRFKVINDSLGHRTGDALLKIVAQRLSACMRPGDTVARQGGDEFVVVMADLANEDDVAPVVRKLLDSLSHRITAGEHEVVVTASVGVALYPRDGETAETLLKNADGAMYRAKELGRNGFQFYTPEMNARTLQRLELEAALRRALERDELVLFYQPKVELQHGKVVGAEALIRWRHPVLGLVSPADFIPLAEETGLIVSIGEWVIATACHQLKDWRNEGLPDISVAVNLSARQFVQEGLSSVVAQALRSSGVPANRLELEVTESAVMQDPERTVATLRELKRIGVSLSLDDFGTGYSSLNYLKRFPINTLKIDQSFVRDITTDPDDAAIAAAVISLAHILRLSVIAEGVETAAQLGYLRQHGCDEIQGYYFSRPLPADQFAALLLEGRVLSG